ncbi:hypothetical protein FGIG_00733 [Fasciola gigantica]|uniref:Uncharacterized protein n=1 Tax=Fasciola gigantica TaxID=46835 RepID=A0A504YZE2_FASGI|nr:hypothetical protein FGIG_00733 [Fasciola gigantica]
MMTGTLYTFPGSGMTSVQVNRFQKRVLGLQTHHNLATQRHSVASKNYETFSRSMMDSLVSHLAENDKKMKKTKRITKPRGALSQGFRSTRSGEIAKPMDRFPAYTGYPSYCPTVDPCASGTTYNMLPPHFPAPEANIPENVNFEVRHPMASSPAPNKEPVFPPPTYADPLASNVLVSQCPSSGTDPFNDYMTGKPNFTRDYSALGLDGGFTRYDYFHPQHSRDLSYRIDGIDTYFTDPNFHTGVDQQSSRFPAHHQSSPQTSWPTHSARELTEPLEYSDSFLSNLDPCISSCNGKYPDFYGQYSTKSISATSQDCRNYARSVRVENLTVIPCAAGSGYTGINPILASTYPVASGSRSEKVYGSCPQLSDSTVVLGPTVHGNFRPPSLNVNTMQVPNRPSFNSVNYL